MTTQSALVTTIHRVFALHRIDLAGIAGSIHIPLATVRRVTTPTSAPTALAAWEAMLRAVDASVHVVFQGKRYPVILSGLSSKKRQEVHARLAERTFADNTLGPTRQARTTGAMTREQASHATSALRRRVTQIISEALPTGKHRSTSLFAPVAAMIAGVAAAGVLGRSYETLELVTGIPGRTHRQLCAPDERRPVAILQTILGLVGMVVVIERRKAQWVIGQTTATSATFLKPTHEQAGAPAHEHLPQAPSLILQAFLGERLIAQDLIAAAPRAGISQSTLKHWARRRRDPTLEALETLVGAMGGIITLHGRLEQRITPNGPTPERLDQAFRQTCSAYRWSVGRATGLTEDGLSKEIRRRVKHTRDRVNEHLRLMPGADGDGLVTWIRIRRAALQQHGLGSVLELSLITGLNRRIIDRILLDAESIDTAHVRALKKIGISITVTMKDDASTSFHLKQDRPDRP